MQSHKLIAKEAISGLRGVPWVTDCRALNSQATSTAKPIPDIDFQIHAVHVSMRHMSGL